MRKLLAGFHTQACLLMKKQAATEKASCAHCCFTWNSIMCNGVDLKLSSVRRSLGHWISRLWGFWIHAFIPPDLKFSVSEMNERCCDHYVSSTLKCILMILYLSNHHIMQIPWMCRIAWQRLNQLDDCTAKKQISKCVTSSVVGQWYSGIENSCNLKLQDSECKTKGCMLNFCLHIFVYTT